MKKPATPKARDLLAKLQALAERGINGEKIAAKKKLAALKRRFDWTLTAGGADIFAGIFIQSSQAAPIIRFDPADFDIANSVKWAIETATGVPCLYHDGALLAQAEPATANRLHEIAATVTGSMTALWKTYQATPGVNLADRGNFILGLYEGMMNEARTNQPLPTRATDCKLRKAKKRALNHAPGLSLHPYSVAVNLGKQIRFCVPLEEIAGELQQTITAQLPA